MKKYTQQLLDLAKKIAAFASKYSLMIFIVVFAVMAAYLVTRIGHLSRLEPTQAELDKRLENIRATQTNEDSIKKLQELQDRNISIEALFDNGRTNPFED